MMRSAKHPALLLAALVLVRCAAPESAQRQEKQPGAVELLRDEARRKPLSARWAQQLADEVGARSAGSPGDAKAVAWALAKMKELGLQNVRAEPVAVPHWERRAERAELVGALAQKISVTALGHSVGTPAQGLEAELVEVPTLEALAALPDEQVRGKIVFVNQPTERTRTGEGYGRTSRVRHQAAASASKKGALAALVRSLATANARLPHTGSMSYEDGVARIPAAAVSIPDAELLHRLGLEGRALRLRLALDCGELPEAQSANVVGEIVGSERPQEVILLGAHLDSWDLGTGALDDAAGVGMVLETARLLAHAPQPPLRTVRVVLFANEELGLSGANAYAAAHASELPQHVLALEADHGDGAPTGLSYVLAPEASAALVALADPLRAFQLESPTLGERIGADLTPLRAAGVPVAGLDQDATKYFDHHHSADDTADKIDPTALGEAGAALATFVYSVSTSRADLGRLPEPLRKSERRKR